MRFFNLVGKFSIAIHNCIEDDYDTEVRVTLKISNSLKTRNKVISWEKNS